MENARPKICLICETTFHEEDKFYNHVMFSHEKVFEHFCDQCDKSFSSKFQLDRHLKLHNVNRKFHCLPCNKKFVDKQSLDEHNAGQHSTDKRLKCNICDKVYSRASRLRKHMTSHEEIVTKEVQTCRECSMAFVSEKLANGHCRRMHDEDNSFIEYIELSAVVCCEFCELAFVHPEKLLSHKHIHNGEKPYECEFCTTKYETFSQLRTHSNTHNNLKVRFPVQRNYMCDNVDCLKQYRHWSDLINHRKTVHLINPTIFKCSECDVTFYQSWKFDYHKKTFHGKPEKCTLCDDVLSSSITLKAHMRKKHSAKEPKEISLKSKLRKKKTTEIDNYIEQSDESGMYCSQCGKTFPSRNNARSHIEMVHLKIRKHSCSTCDKQFYLKKDLDDHIRLHTAEQPFKCAVESCGKQFRTNSMLCDHKKYWILNYIS